MRAARLHGVRDLRVEELPDPAPASGELLVRIEACGVCPTDVRKYLLGTTDGYPLNPGHEWVGHVEALGAGVDLDGWEIGQRIYGDTYAGYAELAVLPIRPGPWSHGPLRLPEGLARERAIFVEPFADCLHAVVDQARVEPGARVVVVGGGQMGLQLVVAAALTGAEVTLIEPHGGRRSLGLELGAQLAAPDVAEIREKADAVILSIGVGALVEQCVELAAPGGRVVLFAGFGDAPRVELDLNLLHYQEIAVVGSEWIGTPPNQRSEHYAAALEALVSGRASLERLVTGRCDLDGLEDAFADVQALRGLKTMLVP
ncbi:MAG: alcohol dehydrogenase catalytic domain-containing protein [Gaiellaceae bacterium]